MSRVSFASHPYLLGFEALDRLIERTAKSSSDAYPPFNIEMQSGDRYRITLALAGFSEDDLSITIEDNQLVVRGKQPADAGTDANAERVFLHRGIAARQFQRSFVLAEGVEVRGANLDCGLLHIDLERTPPEPVVQTVKITPTGR